MHIAYEAAAQYALMLAPFQITLTVECDKSGEALVKRQFPYYTYPTF